MRAFPVVKRAPAAATPFSDVIFPISFPFAPAYGKTSAGRGKYREKSDFYRFPPYVFNIIIFLFLSSIFDVYFCI